MAAAMLVLATAKGVETAPKVGVAAPTTVVDKMGATEAEATRPHLGQVGKHKHAVRAMN